MTNPSPNRATRRRAAHPKGEGVMLPRQSARTDSLASQRQRDSLKSHPNPPIGISNGYGASADIPPDNFGEPESSPAAFVGYRGKYGLIKTNIVASYAAVGLGLGGFNSPDGVLFLTSAEGIADAWIAWGKSNPVYMRVVNILWGGALMTLLLAHAPLIAGVMGNHGVKVPSLGSLVNRKTKLPDLSGAGSNGHSTAAEPESPVDFMAYYQPVGAHAPTDDLGPPPSVDVDAPLRVYPDEGIPADVDSQLRSLAQTTGVPYQQIRDQYLLETAQDRIAHNQRVTPPSTLGTPVTNPER